MQTRWVLAALLSACTTGMGSVEHPGEMGDDTEGDRSPGGAGAAVPDVRCAGVPDADPVAGFRHATSQLIVALGDANHRGIDLVTSATAATQTLEGWISYSAADKALEDEDVELFACFGGAWGLVGTARTDDEGHFALALSDPARLPIGMRDLFASVVGDRSGARFLGYVAPEGTPVILSDVDGTLTSSENAFFQTILLGVEPAARVGAARAYSVATVRGYQLVYMTARGSQYTGATRDWLAHQGFPRGPLRLATSFITLPGGDTVEYKARTARGLADAGLVLAAGVGNRATDITAYGDAGIAADRVFIELPEYAEEVQPRLASGEAIGFASYDELRATQLEQLPAR